MSRNEESKSERTPRQLTGYCRTRIGGAVSIQIFDVSIAGCIFDRRASIMTCGQRVLIKLPGLSYLAAKVAWIDDNLVAVSFEHPLYEPVLKHIMRYYAVAA